jgi:hypothetical protein
MAQELDLGYDLFGAVMNAREVQARNLAAKLVDIANEKNLPIYIHGKAYKPGVEYLDGSYSLLVGRYCTEFGFAPTYIDPLTGDNFEPTKPGVFILAHSSSTTYRYTHSQHADDLYCEIPSESEIVDPWRKFSTGRTDIEVIHYGNTRLG